MRMLEQGSCVEIFNRNRKLILWEGILCFALGLFAICAPCVFTVGIELLLGFVFVALGIVQVVRAIKTWAMEGSGFALVWGLVTFGAGLIMLFNPIVGLIALTSLLCAYFLVEGVAKFVLAFKLGKEVSKFWLITSGVLSCALALIIITGFPGTLAWSLGLLVGIDLLFFGFLMFALYSALPKIK